MNRAERRRASREHGDPVRADPAFQAFERDVRANLIPKLSESTFITALVPGGPPDVKMAVEIGLALLLDKPIVPLAIAGRPIPANLRRVALDVIECPWDVGDPRASPYIADELERIHRAHPDVFG